MKQKTNGFSQRYAKALRKHLKQGPHASLQPALELGHLAVALGLETLELARIHERVITVLKTAGGPNRAFSDGEAFFFEAISPIAETHRTAKQGRIDLSRLNKALNRRTLELAATNRQLQQGTIRRKAVETALKKSAEHYTLLLKDSLKLQEGLRQLTHQVLAGQEEERLKISRELHDQIAQTLLGINVRLVGLKKEARLNTRNLKNEIASTQRLVLNSAKSVRRAARKFRKS